MKIELAVLLVSNILILSLSIAKLYFLTKK